MPHHARIARSNRKLRSVLGTVSLLSLAVAFIMMCFYLFYRDSRMLLVAAAYVAVAAASGVALAMLKAARRRSRRERSRRRRESEEDGMVMILVLLLLGVLAAITIHTQMAAGTVLKRARARQERTELRLAASDAAWYFLRHSAGGGSGTQWPAPKAITLPSGIETEVAARVETNLVLLQFPAFAGNQRQGMHTIQATASRSGLAEVVTCLVRHRPNGKIRILGWIEGR